MPVPVEPMKVVGAIVIAEGLSSNEIAASGIVMGVIFLVLGLCKGMNFIQGKVPKNVIRGIQLGLALILIKTSIKFITGGYTIAIICIAIIILFSIAGKLRIPNISAIIIMLLGVTIGIYNFGIPKITLISSPPVIIPNIKEFIDGSWLLVIPQIPLTVTNAILATALLISDLLHRETNPDKLSISIGLMNLTSVPFGGFPMCHGAGGLAAQYRFGARTGGSNIISGLILIPIALFFASPEFVAIIPLGIFGALLIFIAIELGKHSFKTDSYIVTGVTAVLSLITNITVAFIVGMILAFILKKVSARNPKS